MSTESYSSNAGKAPRVFITYSQDDDVHTELVRRFATFLRVEAGVDVHLDQWYDDGRRDWSLWAVEQLTEAEFVLVVGSPAYRRRADGRAPHDEGRGAQFEAAIIRDNLTRNLPRETRRVLPVLLPGRSVDDLPTFLCAHSQTHYRVAEFTIEAIQPLLRAFDNVRSLLPPRGPYRGHRGRWERPEPAAAGAVPGSGALLLTTSSLVVTRGPDLRPGSAELDGVHYGNSLVHRCSVFCADPRSAVEYNLGRRFRTFESVVGVLDDAAETEQTGYFQVFLDGVAGPAVRTRLGEPVRMLQNVTGVLRLRLVAYRPDTVGGPLLAGALLAGGRSARLPALGWGDPSVTA